MVSKFCRTSIFIFLSALTAICCTDAQAQLAPGGAAPPGNNVGDTNINVDVSFKGVFEDPFTQHHEYCYPGTRPEDALNCIWQFEQTAEENTGLLSKCTLAFTCSRVESTPDGNLVCVEIDKTQLERELLNQIWCEPVTNP